MRLSLFQRILRTYRILRTGEAMLGWRSQPRTREHDQACGPMEGLGQVGKTGPANAIGINGHMSVLGIELVKPVDLNNPFFEALEGPRASFRSRIHPESTLKSAPCQLLHHQ
jgi:hypothetical protein